MKVIVIKEEDIKQLMSNLEIKKFRLVGGQLAEEEIHRQFNYVIVNWLHEHGSSYPN
jgi:hypothetical protein